MMKEIAQKTKNTKIIKGCTCGFLIGSIVLASFAEILDCPIHGYKSCQTQHTEQTYVSLGTISSSGTISF
jgi:hypothetical protein